MLRERELKSVLVLVGLVVYGSYFSHKIGGLRDPAHSDTEAIPMMMGIYFTLGICLLTRGAESGGASQPDRLHGLVELRLTRRCCLHWDLKPERTLGVSDRIRCARGTGLALILMSSRKGRRKRRRRSRKIAFPLPNRVVKLVPISPPALPLDTTVISVYTETIERDDRPRQQEA